jgi:5-methylcytosine-specific restriction protein A
MNARAINKIVKLQVKHFLYRKNGTWYHHLKHFPSALFDDNGFVIFHTELEYINNPSLKHKLTLHIRKGISSLSGYTKFTNEQKYLLGIPSERLSVDETVVRKIREISILNRKQKLVDKVKLTYDFACQICETKLNIRINTFYCEAHHIKPLGSKHNGPDILENMISVCPNHHVLLDLGAISINLSDMVVKHTIRQDFIDYHNKKIFNCSIG